MAKCIVTHLMVSCCPLSLRASAPDIFFLKGFDYEETMSKMWQGVRVHPLQGLLVLQGAIN